MCECLYHIQYDSLFLHVRGWFIIFTYKTIAETATNWNVSSRYVQGLCRKGRIVGAIKRGGVWFIPEHAVNPSGKNGNHFRFKGTKKKLFAKAVELFAERSYEAVTIKDIAEEVGIAQSAFYNHFKSKQEIMDAIYDFFKYYYLLNRPTLKELEPILQQGSLTEILNCVNYNFNLDYEDLLLAATKIIFQRMFIDVGAREIYRTILLESGVDYALSVFERALEIGRLASVDTHALSVFCNMNRHFYFLNWLSNSKLIESKRLVESQRILYEMIAQNLEGLN